MHGYSIFPAAQLTKRQKGSPLWACARQEFRRLRIVLRNSSASPLRRERGRPDQSH